MTAAQRAVEPPSQNDLIDSYGIRVDSWRRHPFGFESECWIADDRWFVKVWRHTPPQVLALLERLQLPVPVPLRTREGDVVARSGGRSFAVFPYIEGRPATWDDWREIARAMRSVHDHPTDDLDVPHLEFDEESTQLLRDRLDHPWIRDRRPEILEMVGRLEAVVDRARHTERPSVLCHGDLIGDNLLIGDDGRVAAIIDWDWVRLAPRELDLWVATEGPRAHQFLEAYGDVELDPVHLEYALLQRAVGDLAARVAEQVDRAGIETWGFDRWRRLDANLSLLLSTR